MPEDISPRTEKRLRSLCRHISAEHNLGWDSQKELYSGMKDRYHELMSGQMKLSEEETFILLRKYFEKPEQIRELLREAHPHEGRSDFYGRIATLLVATLGLGLISEILDRLLFHLVYAFHQAGVVSRGIRDMTIAAGDILLTPLVLLVGFLLWRSTKEGRKFWFQNTGPYNIVTVIVLLVVVPELLWNIPAEGRTEYFPHGYAICLMLQCLVWLWWCAAPPRWNWGMMICPVFWVFYEITIHPFFLMFGLYTSPSEPSILIYDQQRFLSYNILSLVEIAAVAAVLFLLLDGFMVMRRKSSEGAVR